MNCRKWSLRSQRQNGPAATSANWRTAKQSKKFAIKVAMIVRSIYGKSLACKGYLWVAHSSPGNYNFYFVNFFFSFLQQIPKMNVLWLRILYRAPSPHDPLFKLYLKTLGQLRKPLNSVANNQTFYDLLYSCCSWVTNSQRRAATEKMLLLHPKEFQSFVYPSKRIYFVRDSRENNL